MNNANVRQKAIQKRIDQKNRQRQAKESVEAAPRKNALEELSSVMGNRTMQRMFQTGEILAKLNLSQPGDFHEIEADRIANEVISSATSGPQTIKTRPRRVYTATRRPGIDKGMSNSVSSRILGLRGGKSLGKQERSFYESRMGADFSGVRVHTGPTADQLTNAINARAFTYNNNIVFGKGEYQPGTTGGKRLMAHELAHVMQQGQGVFREIDDNLNSTNQRTLRNQVALSVNKWKSNFVDGVENFADDKLVQSIYSLESGDVGDFLVNLLGNIIWAAAGFATGGLAFGVGLVGVVIGSLPEISRMAQAECNSFILQVKKVFQLYADKMETELLKQAKIEINVILNGNREMFYSDNDANGVTDAYQEIINKIFASDVIKFDEAHSIKGDKILSDTQAYATRMYDVFDSIWKVTNNYRQRNSYALPGVDNFRVRYENDYNLCEYNTHESGTKLELLTRHYGARMNYHLERPEIDNWNDTIIHNAGSVVYSGLCGTSQIAPTNYYKYWFLYFVSSLRSQFYIDLQRWGYGGGSLESYMRPVQNSIQQLKTSMQWVIDKQIELRERDYLDSGIILFNPQDTEEYRERSRVVYERLLRELREIEDFISSGTSREFVL